MSLDFGSGLRQGAGMSAQSMQTRFRLFLLMMAGLAIAVQSLIPAGFMPEMGKQAGSFMTICSGMGEKTVYVPGDSAPDHQAGQSACAFSFLIAAPQTVAPVLPAYIAASFVPADMTEPVRFAARPSFNIAHPPTGPPVIL